MRIVRHKDAASFLEHAGSWLEKAEPENNLILGIANDLRNFPGVLKISPYYLTFDDGENVTGAAFMHPPRQLIVPNLSNEIITTLANYLNREEAPASGVHGPEPAAQRFTEIWAAMASKQFRVRMHQRIYACKNVILTVRTRGHLRAAKKEDEPLLMRWAGEFCRDAGIPDEATATIARVPGLTAKGLVYVWEDGEITSMAGLTREMRRGFSVSLVYTPPQFRNKGYATTCVAELTKLMLAAGKTFCCLYTDLANSTSNRIYQKIGYQPVCDVQDWIFE